MQAWLDLKPIKKTSVLSAPLIQFWIQIGDICMLGTWTMWMRPIESGKCFSERSDTIGKAVMLMSWKYYSVQSLGRVVWSPVVQLLKEWWVQSKRSLWQIGAAQLCAQSAIGGYELGILLYSSITQPYSFSSLHSSKRSSALWQPSSSGSCAKLSSHLSLSLCLSHTQTHRQTHNVNLNPISADHIYINRILLSRHSNL